MTAIIKIHTAVSWTGPSNTYTLLVAPRHGNKLATVVVDGSTPDGVLVDKTFFSL